jgi:hypothetical protein
MNKKTIVFDFDGVIHKGYSGWKDGSIYGEIDIKLIDYIKQLLNQYYVVISSNRPAIQIVEYLTDMNLGIEFEVFEKDLKNNMFWNKDNIIGVTNEKAVGILYIDDRGLYYDNNQTTEDNISCINDRLEKIEPIFDNLKEENKELKNKIEKMTKINLADHRYASEMEDKYLIEKAKVDKAIDYLNTATIIPENILHYRQCLLDILESSD